MFTGHTKQAASIQGVASHLEHQLAGAKIGHDLKDRESEQTLAARGVIHSGASSGLRCGVALLAGAVR